MDRDLQSQASFRLDDDDYDASDDAADGGDQLLQPRPLRKRRGCGSRLRSSSPHLALRRMRRLMRQRTMKRKRKRQGRCEEEEEEEDAGRRRSDATW